MTGRAIPTSVALLMFVAGFLLGSAFYVVEARAHRRSLAYWRETLEKWGDSSSEYDQLCHDLLEVVERR